jgi:phosphate transport system protein
MSVHLQMEIDRLKKQILTLSAMVEENVGLSVKAAQDRAPELAAQVMEQDEKIDAMEIEIEEECLKALVLYQPVAIDLRYIISVLKINNDLERIGDLAVSVAKNAMSLNGLRLPDLPVDLPGMADMVKAILKKSLDSMINLDADLAREVLTDDNAIDEVHNETKDLIHEAMGRDSDMIRALSHLLQISRRLERIADHATNIAEDVIYMVEAEIIRHNPGAE